MEKMTRRSFLAGTASVIVFAGCATTKKGKAPAKISKSPNEKINLAAIGAGGKGEADTDGAFMNGRNNMVALCDVDDKQAVKSFNRWPDAVKYRDFRKMLEKEKSIEAVTVSTADHTHAVAAALAMSMGKHVYVQKPLTHTVYEARKLADLARKYKVVSQMGNQGHSDPGVRYFCEMLWDDAIGNVKEVHCWTNRPIWPQGLNRPSGSDPVPATLDWDLWLGPAPERPYVAKHPDTGKNCYCPFVWRGWWDFGCGALGDMACHIMDAANWSLFLGAPSSVECLSQDKTTAEMAPVKSVLKYEFPERPCMATGGKWKGKKLPAVTMYWHDGGNLPPRPEGIGADVELGEGDNGTLMIGEKGVLTCGCYGGDPRLLPADKFKDYVKPDPYIPRVGGSYGDWITSIKEGKQACSNFDYAGPFTEMVNLGNVAIRAGQKILWDSKNMKITNVPDANKYIKVEYRKGWTIEL